MSKNIFNVLAVNDDSDDERKAGSKKVVSKLVDVKKDTKKEYRAKDTQLREKFGDKIDKDSRPPRSDIKPRDDYASNEKRPYERHSGTGRPAFKKDDYKKGGHGKGNVGGNAEKDEKDANEENKNEEETKVELVKLPEEEIVTLDDYINNTGVTFGIKTDNQVKNRDPKTFEDATTKAIISKRTIHQEQDKKTAKVQEKKQVSKNLVDIEVDTTGQRRRDQNKNTKKPYVKYDKTEFPSLD